MNKLLLTCLTTILLFPVFSQNIALKLFVEDAVGQKDTIIFGVNDVSTLGIDTSFGELNIFGTPFDSLDIRVIQRDSTNFNCIKEDYYQSSSPNLYFPDNIDSKIDYRPFTWSYQSVYQNFEFFIYANNYPVTVRADFSEIQFNFLEWYSTIRLLDSNCNSTDTKSIYYDSMNDSLFILMDSSFNTLVVNFDTEVSIEEFFLLNNLLIYPNPTQNRFTVSGIQENSSIIVLDVMGKVVHYIPNTIHQTQITTTNWAKGMYIVQLKGNTTIASLKVVKQ